MERYAGGRALQSGPTVFKNSEKLLLFSAKSDAYNFSNLILILWEAVIFVNLNLCQERFPGVSVLIGNYGPQYTSLTSILSCAGLLILIFLCSCYRAADPGCASSRGETVDESRLQSRHVP